MRRRGLLLAMALAACGSEDRAAYDEAVQCYVLRLGMIQHAAQAGPASPDVEDQRSLILPLRIDVEQKGKALGLSNDQITADIGDGEARLREEAEAHAASGNDRDAFLAGIGKRAGACPTPEVLRAR